MSYPVVYPPPPNQTDYTAFLRTQAGIPVSALPDNSPYIPDTLQIALDVVNRDLATAVPNLNVLAVYNLATDRLINFAPDQTPAITEISWSGGLVTVVTTLPLPATLPQGQEFDTIVSGNDPTGYNGGFTATVLGGSSFSYPLTADPGVIVTAGAYLLPFFSTLRASWNLNTSLTGVVEASSDQATSTTLAVPEQLRALTLGDIQKLKTPFGRAYLEIAQAYGQELFGIT